jgi:hypothetical protein
MVDEEASKKSFFTRLGLFSVFVPDLPQLLHLTLDYEKNSLAEPSITRGYHIFDTLWNIYLEIQRFYFLYGANV